MYLKFIQLGKWFKIGKDNRRNWFVAVGNPSGTKWAVHSKSLFYITKNIMKASRMYKYLHK